MYLYHILYRNCTYSEDLSDLKFSNTNNEGVDILDVDNDNDFKDTGKIKSNELIPQLAYEVNEHVLILETILKKDECEHEMDNLETLGRKYL